MLRYVTTSSPSATMSAILGYVYNKEELLSHCGRYAHNVIEGLVELNLVRKVISKKGTFYFKTDQSKNFKAIDFAKGYLWAFHNSLDRQIKEGKKYILCFDSRLKTGSDLVEIEEAIKKRYV